MPKEIDKKEASAILQGDKKLTSGQEKDLIGEIQRLIEKKKLGVKLVDERAAALSVGDPCTHCTMCPCMVIG